MSRPLRITQVVTNNEFAGTERYVSDVAVALGRRGHHVEVIGGAPASLEPIFAGEPVTWRPGADVRTAVRSLRDGGRRDVVHTHIARSDFVAVLAAPTTRGARISTRHITARRGYSPIAFRLGRGVRRSLACEIAVSRWTSDQLDRPADRVLLNGVEPQPDVVEPRTRRVLVAQRLAPEKDTATALRAWQAAGLGERGWRLTVAGSGSEDADLRELATSLGIEGSVDFAGWLSEVGQAYRTSSILLAPAPTEPCGLTILEAMAQGLPVVAAGAGGHLETVGRHPSARLFPSGDVAAAADHLVALADDDDAREAYGRELRELQRKTFTVDGHVDRLEAIYRDCLATGGSLSSDDRGTMDV